MCIRDSIYIYVCMHMYTFGFDPPLSAFLTIEALTVQIPQDGQAGRPGGHLPLAKARRAVSPAEVGKPQGLASLTRRPLAQLPHLEQKTMPRWRRAWCDGCTPGKPTGAQTCPTQFNP